MKTTDEIFGLLASGFEASRDEKDQDFDPDRPLAELIAEIGRASCRERV